jgi:DNA-binding transcriptional ArsR family regulator
MSRTDADQLGVGKLPEVKVKQHITGAGVNMTPTIASGTRSDEFQEDDEDAGGEESIDEDEIFDALSERRRREAIAILEDVGGGPIGAREIADEIAADEAGDEPVVDQDEKRVYVALYQCHLPRLDERDVVEWDRDEKIVEAGPHFDEVAELRRYVDDELGAGRFKRLWSLLTR